MRDPSPRPAAMSATLILALCAVAFGLTPLFARALQTDGMGDASIALSRYLFSGVLMIPFLPRAREKRREALTLGLAGVFMGLGWIGYLEGLRSAPVAAVGVVYLSYPLFTVLFAWALLGMPIGRRGLGSAALILTAGAVLLDSARLDAAAVRGLLWSAPAPVTFGLIVVVVTAITPRLTTVERMACGLGGAALGLAPLAAFDPSGSFVPGTPMGWFLIAAMGLCTAVVPQYFYASAAPRVGPARASATGALELPTMIALGWLVHGEAIGPRETLAAALVLSAVLIAPAIPTMRHQPESAQF